MKIMAVNNTVMFEKGNGLFVYKETGKFFEDLRLHDNEVTIFQFSMVPKESDFMANFDLTYSGLNIVNIRRRKSKLLAYIKALTVGFNEIRKADFVYLFYPGHICTILALFCLIQGRRFGLYVRGEKGIFGRIQRFLYKRASIIFTISPWFTDLVKKAGGNAKTIRPMMSFSEKDIYQDREYIRKEILRFLYVGRIEQDKGVFEILEAVEHLVDQGFKNFTIHFVGDGVHMANVHRIIEDKNIGKYVVFHGTVSDKESLRGFYKDSDLFIFPSHHEGFPRVIYEAMIFGIPIITSFVGTISYLMRDNINCYEVKPGDFQDLASKIKKFIEGFPESAAVAKNGTRTISAYLADKPFPHSVQLNQHLQRIDNV